MSACVYILWSEHIQRYYIGVTENLERRVREHNQGISKYTKRGVPWELVWSTQKANKSEAVLLERKLKNLKSGKRIAAFIQKYS